MEEIYLKPELKHLMEVSSIERGVYGICLCETTANLIEAISEDYEQHCQGYWWNEREYVNERYESNGIVIDPSMKEFIGNEYAVVNEFHSDGNFLRSYALFSERLLYWFTVDLWIKTQVVKLEDRMYISKFSFSAPHIKKDMLDLYADLEEAKRIASIICPRQRIVKWEDVVWEWYIFENMPEHEKKDLYAEAIGIVELINSRISICGMDSEQFLLICSEVKGKAPYVARLVFQARNTIMYWKEQFLKQVGIDLDSPIDVRRVDFYYKLIHYLDAEMPEITHQGREKCEQLRETRLLIAEANEIEYALQECHRTGPCSGTCPVCDAEISYIEEQLRQKKERGEKINLAGIASACLKYLSISEDINEY